MFHLKVLITFAVVTFASAAPGLKGTDQTTVENIAKCIRTKMHDGVSEIGFPSHDPLYVNNNFTFGIQFIYYKLFFVVRDGYYFGIPDNTLSLTQLSDDSDDVASFKYELRWPNVFINATWDKTVDTNTTDVLTSGLMNMSLTDAVWKGNFKIRKPILSGTVEELTLESNSVANAEVGVTNFGAFEDFLFSKVFKYLWKILLDSHHFGHLVEKALREKFQYEWLDQPDRLKTLLEGCEI